MRESVAHKKDDAMEAPLIQLGEADTRAHNDLKSAQAKLFNTYVDLLATLKAFPLFSKSKEYKDLLRACLKQIRNLQREMQIQEAEFARIKGIIENTYYLSKKEKKEQEALKAKKEDLEARLLDLEPRFKSLEKSASDERERFESLKRVSGKEVKKLRDLVQEADELSLAQTEDIQRKNAQIRGLEKDVSSLKSRLSGAENKKGETKIVRKLPKRPDRIDFEYQRNEMGLISMVTMKAEGYSDVVIDVVRGSNHRFKEMEIKVK